MRKPFVAGNWKLNGTCASVRDLASAVMAGSEKVGGVEIAICPSFVHLHDVLSVIGQSAVNVGAQNCSLEDEGAFTGEVSAAMLADCGCTQVIVGHSERRQLYSDTNKHVAKRFAAVQSAGMTPILCVGETLPERESGSMHAIIGSQLDAIIDLSGVNALANAVVAYEPVWAIGTGETATPEQAQEVHHWLREKIAAQDAEIASTLRIVYGGSVKSANAAELFGQPDIDGGLIGGAALVAEEFLGICSAA